MIDKKTDGDPYTTSNIEITSKEIGKKGFVLTEFNFIGHNLMKVSLLQNGNDYGNSGNGPVVKIKFEDQACSQIYLNNEHSDGFTIEFRGISERNQIVSALELILKELKK